MITTRPVTVTDALYVMGNARPEDNLDGVEQLADTIRESDCGVTLLDGDEPIGILVGKRHDTFKDMGHAWAVMTEKAYGHGRELVKTARAFINDNMDPLGYKLVYTYCLDEADHHKKWVRLLGFKKAPEGDHHDPEGQLWRGYRYVKEQA